MTAGRPTVRPALRVFVLSRAAIWALAVGAVLLLDGHLNPRRGPWDTERLHDAGVAVDVLARWDSTWFLQIAEQGYSWPSVTPAFFPLYPVLLAALGRALGGHFVVAGALISLAAGAAAFALLYRLALVRLGGAAALRTVLFLALAPMSVFLGAVYSESLFLALAVACFLAAERDRLGCAAALAGLALLARPQGAALIPALWVFSWQLPAGRARRLGVASSPVAIFLAYPLVLWIWLGHPLAFVDAESQWGRHLSLLGPLGGTIRAAAAGDLVELAFAVTMTALAVVAWQRLGPAYGLYAVGVIALAASGPSERLGGLYSFPRLSLVAFPCFMALAGLVRARWQTVAIATVSSALLAVYVLRWALWYWVS